MRAQFFGEQGDTRWNQRRLQEGVQEFPASRLDIRDRQAVRALVNELRPNVIVHAAAPPSTIGRRLFLRGFRYQRGWHPESASRPPGTPAPSHRSCICTNKVYGDAPNQIRLMELASLGYGPCLLGRHPVVHHRSVETLAVRRVKVAAGVMVRSMAGGPACPPPP
jgi:hypothetical protein